MSARFDELRARHRALKARSAAQRRELGLIVRDLEAQLEHVDRFVDRARSVARHPLVIAAAVGVLAALGPRRILGVASRAMVLAPLARRLAQLRGGSRGTPRAEIERRV